MAPRAIMIQGTGSNVGKSLLVAGLCRAAKRRGISVAPFKPQNMSNNASVTSDGGEIGRAQALQAVASGRDASVHMNPVLLKPESDCQSQVIVQGEVRGKLGSAGFGEERGSLMTPVLESFYKLSETADLILVEGAGSPAEVNLRQGDIANMGFARAADVPVILAGDIDRGGVIAQIVGTHAVVSREDREIFAGFLVNKFRGDVELFSEGYREIGRRTGWTGFGVVPWFSDAHLLPSEDAVDLSQSNSSGEFHIVCPMLSRIANFDDLDPLRNDPAIRLTMIPPGRPLPGDADLVILPGTKSTRGDMEFFRQQGWDIDLAAHIRRGGHVLGICGGFQMLGKSICDPKGIDGVPGDTKGLGYLDINTTMAPTKKLERVSAIHAATGEHFEGYEIHVGKSDGPDCQRHFARTKDCIDGAVSADGRVSGTYLHGLFEVGAFRQRWLASIGCQSTNLDNWEMVDRTLDRLSDHLEEFLDVTGIFAAAAPVQTPQLNRV